MEENTTQRKTAAINIIVYGLQDIKSLKAEVKNAFNTDGKDTRDFIFTGGDNTIPPLPKGPAKNHELLLLADTTEGNPDIAGIKKMLDKKQREYLYIQSTNDQLTDVKKAVGELEQALDMGFTTSDFVQIHNRGISIDTIRKQLLIFRNGLSKIMLKKPATLQDGIYPINEKAAEDYARYFDERKDRLKLMKFVPASGAASRMFKFLCEFMSGFDPEKESINAYINRQNDSSLRVFLVAIDKFPFFREILEDTKKNPEYAGWRKDLRYYHFIKTMLAKGRFDFANKPKGILPFHQYDGFAATPVYEHLKESTHYASAQNTANVHFTISEEHLDGFLDAIKDAKPDIEAQSGTSINFSFSYQHKQTDTLAADMNNAPFREDGKLLFRPGGHGALIENLNNLKADIVFVKNIDNVSHNNIEVIALYKKALAGLLMELQQQAFSYLEKLDSNAIKEEELDGLFEFAKERLMINVSEDSNKYTLENKAAYARELLNRPIRVCGMVKNEGEPGGGPFWVKDESGRLSLQIVESSQVDNENKTQNEIFMQSTHFNPVDLVCGLRDYKGNYFNLPDFVDHSTGFIVYKNRLGKDVKSYELPGLWNGAMAGWITVFAEVPLETFNPVKTVNDLLKPAHQPQ